MTALLFRLVVAFTLSAAPATPQTAPSGALLVTVMDPGRAAITGATVTVALQGTQTPTPRPPVKTDKGTARVDGLIPGKYTVVVEYPGFQSSSTKDVSIGTGEQKLQVTLSIVFDLQ